MPALMNDVFDKSIATAFYLATDTLKCSDLIYFIVDGKLLNNGNLLKEQT